MAIIHKTVMKDGFLENESEVFASSFSERWIAEIFPEIIQWVASPNISNLVLNGQTIHIGSSGGVEYIKNQVKKLCNFSPYSMASEQSIGGKITVDENWFLEICDGFRMACGIIDDMDETIHKIAEKLFDAGSLYYNERVKHKSKKPYEKSAVVFCNKIGLTKGKKCGEYQTKFNNEELLEDYIFEISPFNNKKVTTEHKWAALRKIVVIHGLIPDTENKDAVETAAEDLRKRLYRVAAKRYKDCPEWRPKKLLPGY